MKRILLTNDDGIRAEGLVCLHSELDAAFSHVWVCAPDREQSARSHALTLERPLRLNAMGPRQYCVDGTPTDAAYMGINHLLKGDVDLVISGINHGPNMGDDVTYSGTVAAAAEAFMKGIPAVAVSLCGAPPRDFRHAARFVRTLAHRLLEQPPGNRLFLNVNVPSIPGDRIRGIRTTRLGLRTYGNTVDERIDPRGERYYWLGVGELGCDDLEGSDFNAVRDGYVSVTPLTLDMTDIQKLRELNWLEECYES